MKTLLTALVVAGVATAFASPGHAAKYKEITVSGGGTISGKVSPGAAKEKSNSYIISKDTDICGTEDRNLPVVRIKSGGLLDTVVYLSKVKEGKPFKAGQKKLTLNQKKCEFMPYLSAMSNGGVLEAVNSDNTLHNIHTYELIKKARRTVLNVSQPEAGSVVEKKIKLRKGDVMKVECDAHDFMHAFIFVAKNPYFALVNEKGEFEIKDVPPGKYTIKAWHGTLGTKKGKVTIKGGKVTSMNFSF